MTTKFFIDIPPSTGPETVAWLAPELPPPNIESEPARHGAHLPHGEAAERAYGGRRSASAWRGLRAS
jgi:hypothetical protein